MNKFICHFLVFIITLSTLSCTPGDRDQTPNDKPTILVSIAADASFVKAIVGESANVEVIVPTGASPHFFEPKPKDAVALSSASLWFRRGEAFEKRLLKTLVAANSSMTTVDLREGLKLLSSSCCHTHGDDHGHHHHHDALDLHTWLSPKMMIEQVETMKLHLEKLLPESKDAIKENTKALVKKLKRYDKAIKENLKASKGATILVSHPAFAYFCQDYGIEQVSIETEGKEPHPRQIDDIVKKVQSQHIAHIFTQTQYNNKGALAIADILSLGTTNIDPYASDYFETLKLLTEKISNQPLKVQ